MITPSKDVFRELAGRGNIVPVYATLMADALTPVLAHSRIGGGNYAFLLESVVGGEKIGRYSFLGADPFATFCATGRRVVLRGFDGPGSVVEEEHDCPLDRLAELMDAYDAVHTPDLPRFCGGAVGYVGYDVIRQVERLPNPPERSLGLPDLYFCFYHSMIIFDHANRTLKVVAHADLRRDDPDTAYAKAVAEIERLIRRLQEPAAIPVDAVPALPDEDPAFESNFEKEAFQ
ncbi:MAG: anthranilate synthase component I, partial [Planctomycetota bacterium]